MDFMICFLDAVCARQFGKKNRSDLYVCSFVCSFIRSVAFPVAVNHGMQVLSRVGQTQLLPPSHTIMQTVINQHTALQLRSASCSESGCRCPGRSLFTTPIEWESSLGERPIETNERETETGNQVGSFLLKSRYFKLVWSHTTHHYWGAFR